MSALPGQTEESWEKGLRLACELGPEHISAYSLILEEGTPFYNKYKEQETALAADGFCPDGDGAIPPEQRLPDEETERLMYRRTEEILASYGYHRYEISNYAKPGRECRHNLGYWTLVPYIGFGLGASSYEETEGNGGRVRYRNTDDLRAYLAGDFSPCEVEQIEKKDGMAEFVILGLRLMRGVSAAEFRERFGVGIREVYGPVIRKYRENGLLAVNADRMYLTKEGISVSNTIMADFLL
jgi:oxygen-independent coproporphyrinogen-3 oxidase